MNACEEHEAHDSFTWLTQSTEYIIYMRMGLAVKHVHKRRICSQTNSTPVRRIHTPSNENTNRCAAENKNETRIRHCRRIEHRTPSSHIHPNTRSLHSLAHEQYTRGKRKRVHRRITETITPVSRLTETICSEPVEC